MSNFVETTRQGFGSRAKNSFGGIIFGIIAVALGVVLLFWNEGRSVKRYKDLKEGAGSVVEVGSESVDPAMEGKLIHFTGQAKTGSPISDPVFGITESAIRLIRKAEIYQWVEQVKTEEKKNVGGSVDSKKTYSYRQEWVGKPVNSSEFKVTNGHTNTSEMKYRSESYQADKVSVGAFNLPEFLISKISNSEAYLPASLDKAAAEVKNGAKIVENYVYFGANADAPAIGDIRVSFSIIRPGPLSVVAQQQGSTLVHYSAKTGGKVALLESGTLNSQEMFQLAQDRNKMLAWAIRVGGFVLLSMGFGMILKPLAVIADVLPFVGRLVSAGTGLVAFLLAGIVWTLTVGFAWIFYRPILGIVILAVTVLLIFFIFKKMKEGRAAAAGAPPQDTAPPLDTPPPLN
ncbi:TMEM43 family protein [Verrucomicrobiales bacterium BCK34]|nr:TMEM43 family protein [Verrucomicrobiales bacterium BCK34]